MRRPCIHVDGQTADTLVPVIVLSKHGNVDDYIESMGLGAFEYLNKPVSRGEVTRIVKAALQQAEAA